tara:strand:- start:1258 stop:2295 length:1038 start_codon:yes stop_codon:yes gene_type:complete
MNKRWSINGDLNYITEVGDKYFKKLENKKILLTGCTGFIGKWLILSLLHYQKLSGCTFTLHVLTRDKERLLQNKFIDFNHKLIHIIQSDIRDLSLNSNYDYLIHGATSASAELNEKDPVEMFSVVVDGTKKILSELKKVKFSGKALNLSSGAIYGIQDIKIEYIKESDSSAPDTSNALHAYAEAKRSSESLFALYSKQFGFKYANARIFALLGPMLSLDIHFAAGNFIDNALKKEKIVVRGNGRPVRSYLYPTDLVLWILFLLINNNSRGSYNLGSKEDISISKLANIIASKYQTSYVVEDKNDTGWNTSRYVPDNSKIISCSGIKQSVFLNEAIERTYQWNKTI